MCVCAHVDGRAHERRGKKVVRGWEVVRMLVIQRVVEKQRLLGGCEEVPSPPREVVRQAPRRAL
jgi:hypothetical protein